MAFVRQSKYRHIFGSAFKTDQCYSNIRVSRNGWDGNFCAVNPKFVAVITEASGGGSFLVLKHEEAGRVDLNHGQVVGHKSAVLDLDWNPFNDNVIASGSDDNSIKIWMIPDEGLGEEHLVEPIVDLQYHQKRVGQVKWHPTASNILMSVGADPAVLIWNCEEGTVITEIKCHPDQIFFAAWNYNGSLIATTCKDKKLRVIDPRIGDVKQEGPGHEGAKISRVAFMKNNKLFTTGFSRMSERQYGVFDASNLKSLALETIDNNNAPLTIHYDPDINLIYLIGKGDCLVRYYEVSDDKPWAFWLNNFSSTVPQRCCGFLPKRAVNVNQCEIARIYKIVQKGTCEPISMIVPRKSDLFQDDIYPDTQGEEPSLSATEWLEGKNKDPVLISLAEGYVSTRQKSGVRGEGLKQAGKPNKLAALTKKPSATAATSAPAPAPAPAASQSAPAVNAASTNGSATPPQPAKEETPPPKVEEEKPAPPPAVESKPPPKPKPEPVTAKPKVQPREEAGNGVVDGDDADVDALQDSVSLLTNTIKKHEARIAALEELSHNQGSELSELKAEIEKLKELVNKQDKRIKALENK